MGGDLPQIATFHPWRQLLLSPHGLSTHVRSDGDSSLECGVSARSGVLPGAMSTGSTTFEVSTVPPVFGHHSK
jgi:hypothetical protein